MSGQGQVSTSTTAVSSGIFVYNANVTTSITTVSDNHVLGEDWIDVASGTEVWADVAVGSEIWTDAAIGSETWTDVAVGSEIWGAVPTGNEVWARQ